MSKPGYIYRMNWQSFHETTDLQCYIDISDNDNLIDDADDPVIIEMEAGGDPARLSVIDNSESPLTVILAQQLTIRFNSSAFVTMSTFSSGSDNRWSVHFYLGDDTKTIFKGFLISDDNSISEEFLSPPNEVVLTANDGLPLLKDIPLVNADGDNPQGYHKLSDYLSWALRRTGLDLSMRVAFNIKGENDIDDISVPNVNPEHFFYTQYLEAKTFEKEIGESVSSAEAIEIILGHEARIFQYQGIWHIMRVDEVEDSTRGLFITTYDSSGSFVANLGEVDYRKEIGHIHDIKFIVQTIITQNRARKSLRLTYKYETPKELPCNIDFSRGTNETVVSSTEKKYDISCWTLREGGPGYYGTVDGTTATIRKIFNANDEETERYVLLTPRSSFESSSINDITYIESEGIEITEKDKFELSIDFKLTNTTSGTPDVKLLRAVIFGDDGSYWILGEDTIGDGNHKWFDTSLFTINTAKGEVRIDTDNEDWQSVNWSAPAAPVTGKLYIWLNQFRQNSNSFYNQNIKYANLSFSYIPYINGSYRPYTGQYHEVTQDGNYKAKIDEQVYMSDSPNKIFKGALFEFDGSIYNLSGLFYNAAVNPGGPPDDSYKQRYGLLQLFDVWNQYKNEMRIIQGSLQGVDLDKTKNSLPYPAHLINKWNPTDTSFHVTNKYFLLLHFDQGYGNAGWTGVFREVVDLTKTKSYTGNTFKYLS